MSLAERMRAAADTLEEASRRMGWVGGAPWSPRELRIEAKHVAAEDEDEAAS